MSTMANKEALRHNICSRPISIPVNSRLYKRKLIGCLVPALVCCIAGALFQLERFQELVSPVLAPHMTLICFSTMALFILGALYTAYFYLFIDHVLSISAVGITFEERFLVSGSKRKDIPWYSIAQVGVYVKDHYSKQPLGIAIQFRDNPQSAIKSITDYSGQHIERPVYPSLQHFDPVEFRIDACIPLTLYSPDTDRFIQFIRDRIQQDNQENYLHCSNFLARNI